MHLAQDLFLDLHQDEDLLATSALKIKEIPNMGKGLIAMENISMNELLLKIPQDLILTRKNLSLKYSNLTEIQSLVLLITILLKSQSEIFFRKYYENVGAVKLPMFFSEQVLQFSSKDLQRKIQKQYQNYKSDLQEIMAYDSDTTTLTLSWILVNTRCVSLNACNVTIGLIPFLDYLNHSCKSKITPIYNSKDASFELWNNQDIRKGEQVYLSYGHHDNTFLATEYGFVEEDNEFDYVHIETEDVYSKFSIGKLEFLDILTRSRIPQDFVVHFEDVCYSLLMTVRLAVYLENMTATDPSDLSVWEELVRGEREVISQENEEKAHEIIQEICLQVKSSIEKRLNGMRLLKHLYQEEIDLLERLALQELRIVDSVLLP